MAKVAKEGNIAAEIERVPTGIKGLDDITGGGFEKNSTILVIGDAGSGKTTLLLQFLYSGALKYDEPSVFITFEETKESIYRHSRGFGWDFESLEEKGVFSTITYKPHEVKKLIDEGGGMIWDTIHSIGAKRLGIDSLTSYAMLFEGRYQAREAQLSFYEMLRKWGCTTLLSAEGLHTQRHSTGIGIEYLTDGVVLLHHPRQRSVRIRAMEVLKLRGIEHSQKLCPFEFVKGEGIRIYPGEDVFPEGEGKEF
jgi:KaiC/GvpD/RAD55 family RecA-like ATPase